MTNEQRATIRASIYKRLTITCKSCGEQFSANTITDRDDFSDFLVEQGWHVSDGKAFCPNCDEDDE